MKSASLIITLAAVVLFCCSQKQVQDTVTPSAAEWKEMDQFHILMAEAFHPYMDSANLEPAKQNSEELVDAAKKWQEASLPEKVDNTDVRNKLRDLVAVSEKLHQNVKSSNDQATAETLSQLHDAFHELQNLWYGVKHSGEHHQH